MQNSSYAQFERIGRRFILAFLLTTFCCLSAVAADGRGAPLPKSLAIEDINTALMRAEAVHPMLYWHASRDLVLARKNALIEALPDQASTMDVYLILSELVGMLGDGHVSVRRPPAGGGDLLDAWQKSGGFLLYVAVRPTRVGLRVVNSFARGVAVGDLLTTINGRSALALFERAVTLQSGEPALQRYAAGRAFPASLWDLNIEAPYTLEGVFTGKPGRVVVNVPMSSPKTAPRAKDNVGIASKRLADDSVMIRFDRMTADRTKFAEALRQIFSDIAAENPRGIIVDLRNNGGGNSGLGDDLLDYITDKAYRPFARETFKASPECRGSFEKRFPDAYETALLRQMHDGDHHTWNVHVRSPTPNALRFDGPVAVLIGPGTFSSANILANSIGDFHLATLVGSKTAEIPNNYGMACPILLSNSHIELDVPSAYFARANGNETDTSDVEPDINVLSEAINANEDPDVDKAQQWIARQATGLPNQTAGLQPRKSASAAANVVRALTIGICFGLTRLGIRRYTARPWNGVWFSTGLTFSFWAMVGLLMRSVIALP